MTVHGKIAASLLLILGGVSPVAAAAATGVADAQAPTVLVQTARVRLMPVRTTVAGYGAVEFAPEYGQVLDVQGEGVVKRVLVSAGQRVRTGEPLLELMPTANASVEIERARIDLAFAEKSLTRVTELRRRELATNAEVQAAEEARDKARAVLSELRKRYVGNRGKVLRADRDGVVEAVFVRQGQIAASGAPLLRLADESRLRVRLGVEPADLSRIRVGQRVRVRLLYSGAAPVQSRIRQIFAQVNPKTRLAEVVVPLADGRGFLPGAAVRGEILVRTQDRVPTVPRSAVLYEGGRPYVFVVEHGRARRRFVAVAPEGERTVAIRKGLKSGETVVIVGNYELRDGMGVRFGAPR